MKEILVALAIATLALVGTAAAQEAEAVGAADCNGCPFMVVVKGNEVREVATFAMSRTEITFAQWSTCVSAGGCSSNPEPRDAGWGRGNRPVINVSWKDAQEYVKWLSQTSGRAYRLPSEMEWEYAAQTFPDSSPEVRTREPSGNYAWTTYNAADITHPVAQKNANAIGLYDMWGNVWEWVEDCFTPRCSQRVLRGGSYNYKPRQLRANSRNASRPDDRARVIGFRVALTP